MSDVVKHATTHRSRGLGGSDPVPPDLPFINAVVSSMAITANAEIEWDSVFTTDPDTFRYDPADPAGLLFQRDGTYQFMGTMRVAGASSATLRAMNIQSGSVSGGPFGGSPVGDQNSSFLSGFREVTAASDAVLPTSVLWENSIRGFFGLDVTDPGRATLVADHQGSNFTVDASLYIVKLANLIGTVPPIPEAP